MKRLIILLTLFAIQCATTLGRVQAVPANSPTDNSLNMASGDTTRAYFIDIFQKNGSYFHRIEFGFHTAGRFWDGIITEYDPSTCFVGYDTSIIKVSPNYIIPQAVGKTMIYLIDPHDNTTITDSLGIVVLDDHGKLKLNTIRTS